MASASAKRLRGFSFVEVMAVVLVLAVLASVAVGLYGNSRRGAAARVCKANIATIISAESSRSLRTQAYATLADLVGGAEGLNSAPTCPLDGAAYQVVQNGTSTAISTGYAGAIQVKCPNAATHQTATGAASTSHWVQGLAAVMTDSLP